MLVNIFLGLSFILYVLINFMAEYGIFGIDRDTWIYATLNTLSSVVFFTLFFHIIIVRRPEKKRKRLLLTSIALRYLEIKEDIFFSIIFPLIGKNNQDARTLARDHNKAGDYLDKHYRKLIKSLTYPIAKDILFYLDDYKAELLLLLRSEVINDLDKLINIRSRIKEINSLHNSINNHPFPDCEQPKELTSYLKAFLSSWRCQLNSNPEKDLFIEEIDEYKDNL